MLKVESLSKRFGASQALRDVSMEIRPGEIHGLVGENGAGKSTLVRIVTGLVAPDEGTVSMNDAPIRSEPAAALRAGIASVQQELQLCESRSVAENILLAEEPRIAGGLVSRTALKQKAANVLTGLGYDLDPDAVVGRLPVVQRQMVEIARALRGHVSLLILDEATARLEPTDSRRLLADIRELASRGVSILLVSHRLDEILEVTERVTVLRDGEVVASLATANTSAGELTHLMVGRELQKVEQSLATKETLKGAAVLEIANVRLHEEGKAVNLSVHAGEVVGLAGLGDSGRDELVECMFGLRRPVPGGTIKVNGRRIMSMVQAIAAGVGYIGPDRKKSLLLQRPVGDNIFAPKLVGRYGASILRRGVYEAGVKKAIRALDIRPPDPARLASQLSGGNQQRLTIARWLDPAHAVWFLCEPTRGVDVAAKAEIYKTIKGLADRGAAVVISSSELPEILHLCDRIVVMFRGSPVAIFPGEQATEQAISRAAFGIDVEKIQAADVSLGAGER